MRDGRINEGGPPTTKDWNEHEARQEQLPGADRLFVRLGKGTPKPLPELTPEQIAGNAVRLERGLRYCLEALGMEPWDGRWSNRLMHAHHFGRAVVLDAAQWTQPEEQPGTPLPEAADDSSSIGRQAEGGE